VKLLRAALVPCAGAPAVGVRGARDRREAEQAAVERLRRSERIGRIVDEQIDVVESDDHVH
jgi:hypothetical protein